MPKHLNYNLISNEFNLVSFMCVLPSAQIIEYGVGDVLEVLPGQDPAAVDAFLQCCNLNPASLITVSHSLVGRDFLYLLLLHQGLH